MATSDPGPGTRPTVLPAVVREIVGLGVFLIGVVDVAVAAFAWDVRAGWVVVGAVAAGVGLWTMTSTDGEE